MPNPSALNQFITETICTYVATSALNRLEHFGKAPIFEEPLIGFADGNDPLFHDLKEVFIQNICSRGKSCSSYGDNSFQTLR